MSLATLKKQFRFPPNIVKEARNVTRGVFEGWKKVRGAVGGHGPMYKSPCKRFIVKYSLFTTDRIPTLSVPTKFFGRAAQYDDECDGKTSAWKLRWALQPRLQTFHLGRSNSVCDKLDSRYQGICFDVHDENIGVWCGHAVLFDW